MNYEITIPLILFLIGTFITLIKGNIFDKYEKRVSKIKIALLGLLGQAKDELVKMEIKKKGKSQLINAKQEKNYDDLITFMQKSNFLKYANEYEEMLYFEDKGDATISYLAFSLLGLVVPTLLLQQDGDLFRIGFFWLGVNLAIILISIFNIREMVGKINVLHRKYVIGKQSFGGYDYEY